MAPVVPKLLARPHVFLYRLTGGTVGGRLVGCPVLLLTTKGRRSGKLITVPLLYIPNGETQVIIASYGGSPTHPAWYLNLASDPRCVVQIKRNRTGMVAETAGPDQRAVLWQQAIRMYPAYADYQKRTSREIPVVRLRARPVDELAP